MRIRADFALHISSMLEKPHVPAGRSGVDVMVVPRPARGHSAQRFKDELVTANHIDLQRLRATLRLCFKPERADALIAGLATDERATVHSLEPVVRAARYSFGGARWLALVNARAASGDASPPLRPRVSLGAVPALMLALHLGLDLDIETLAGLFQRAPKDAGTQLQRARAAVDATHVSPCPEFTAQIGRYRDPSHDRSERLELLQHLENCGRCRLAFEHARATDEQLISTLFSFEQSLTPLPETASRKRALWLGPLLLWGGIALAGLLLVAVVVAGSHRLLSGSRTPVPLHAANTSPPAFAGWLLESSQSGDVEAVNLASGVHRLLIQGDPAGTASVMLSPDRARIAEMTYTATQLGSALRVYSIDGVKQREWTDLDKRGEYQLDGWLNARELLLSYLPSRQPGEDEAAYNARLASDAGLLAFDVETGQQHVLLQARVDSAYPSPDGRTVAVAPIADDGTITLELRPVQGDRLGEPIASLPRASPGRIASPVLWTPDSQRLVFWARTADGPSTEETPIDVMTLDGRITPIYRAPGNAYGSLLNISPDGKEIFYAEGMTGTSGAPWAYWRLNIDGGAPVKLATGGNIALVSARRTWSPVVFITTQSGGAIALTTEQSFYLPDPQQGSTQTSVASYVAVAFDPAGQSLGPLFDQFTPVNLLTWVPENAQVTEQSAPATNPGPFRQAGRLEGVPALTANSRLSPDGTKVLTYDEQHQSSMAVSPVNPTGETPQLAGAPDDPSWLPDSSRVIGVRRHSTGNGTVSRITIYGDTGNDILTLIDFDPAELGQSTVASYRAPLLAPNGLHDSFFVVDQGNVSLWVGSYDAPPRAVTQWTVPGNANVEPPLIASWAGNDTLIFAQPDDWVKGFPRHVTLERVTVAADGATSLDPLLSWTARGGEKGVVLWDLRLSPDRTQLALRLRRFTGTNLTTDRFDSITVARSADLTRSVEVARGVAGEGMSWSPDGTALAAFIGGRLEIVSSDGKRAQSVETGDITFAYPVWVRPNDIWYQAIEAGGQTLHYTARVTR